MRPRLEIALYAALGLFPLLLTLLGRDGNTAEAELRMPISFPERPATIRELAAWPRAFEDFLNDRFGGRPQLITLHNLARWVLGDSGSDRVVVGKDGWLFLSSLDDVLDRHRGIRSFTGPQLDGWLKKFIPHQEWLHNRGIQTLLVIIPDKHTLYGEFLPDRFRRMGRHPTDQLLAALQERGFTDVLDLRPVLLAAKSDRQLYYRTDSHWNDHGAFLACQAIMDTLEPRLPGLHRLQPDDVVFTPTNMIGGNARLLGLGEWLSEPVERGNVADSAVVETSGGPYRRKPVRVVTRRQDAPAALVFCDSFTQASMMKFLRESFSEVTYFVHWGWSWKWFQGWAFHKGAIRRDPPDIVILAVTERLIPLPE